MLFRSWQQSLTSSEEHSTGFYWDRQVRGEKRREEKRREKKRRKKERKKERKEPAEREKRVE